MDPARPPAPVNGMVLFACDLRRCAEFYRRVLGLSIQEEETTHQVLAGPGLELVIHQVPPELAASLEILDPPVLREDTPLKPVFTVADLAALRVAIEAAGGGLEPPEAAWSWRGHRILDGWDPEGNILQFRSIEKDIPA